MKKAKKKKTKETAEPAIPFGRRDLADCYRNAIGLIVKHKILRICKVEQTRNGTRLIICGLWRVDKDLDGSVQTLELNLKTGKWVESKNLKHWPEVPFFPIVPGRSLDWWKNIVKKAVWKALMASGYKELAAYPERDLRKQGSRKKMRSVSKGQMANALIAKYTGGLNTPSTQAPARAPRKRFLNRSIMEAGAKSLIANFFRHVYDRELMSAILVIDYYKLRFVEYLVYAQNGHGFLKVAREHRNLLPMLSLIEPVRWSDDDMFSKDRWVGSPDVRVEGAISSKLMKFSSPTPWRWLSKTSSVVIKNCVQHTQLKQIAVSNLALANINFKAPVIGYVHLLRSEKLADYGVDPNTQALIRIFLTHCAKIWKEQGYANLRVWLKSEEANISDLRDFLDFEGFRLGLPGKHSTWPSLLARSSDWHERVANEELRAHLKGVTNHVWTSLLGEVEINGVKFTPLTSSFELVKEGYEQKHCIGNYKDLCRKEAYRAFHVIDSLGEISTLGIKIKGSKATFDQQKAYRNRQASKEALAAGKKLVAEYNRALGRAASCQSISEAGQAS